MTPSVSPMGERALRVSLPDRGAVLALYAALARDPVAGQIDLVPGATSLLVLISGPAAPDLARQVAARAREHGSRHPAPGHTDSASPAQPPTMLIETVYQGQDLDRVAELTGLSVDGVIAAHTSVPWRVAFCGFAPGFAYLSDGDPRLAVPRRDTPRTDVPPGAVGLAGPYSGIYPRSSPGGWQLIGRTEAPLWDAQREPPALLRPGMTVVFRAVRPSVTLPAATASPPQRESPRRRSPRMADHTWVVVRPGLQCLVQDLGRPGLAQMGVSRSGAADRAALIRANQLAGNAPEAAALEILLGGAEFQVGRTVTIALTGAPVAVSVSPAQPADGTSDETNSKTASYHDVSGPMDRSLTVPAGSRIRLGRPTRGLRTYVAVHGGVAVPAVLGSRSTDLLAGLGPAPVRAGDMLPIGRSAAADPRELAGPLGPVDPRDSAAPRGRVDPPGAADPSESASNGSAYSILPGPQRDWFTDEARAALEEASWTVTPASNRVGARLSGPVLNRSVTAELPSQGLVRGAIQVPPSGELVVFLADHPVTGGYPVIAVLTEAAADGLAQCRPGAVVRFRAAASRPG